MEIGWCEHYVLFLFDRVGTQSLFSDGADRRSGLDNLGKAESGKEGFGKRK